MWLSYFYWKFCVKYFELMKRNNSTHNEIESGCQGSLVILFILKELTSLLFITKILSLSNANILFIYSLAIWVYDGADDEFGEKTVSVLLDGEESEIVFIDHPSSEMSVSFLCLPFHYFRLVSFVSLFRIYTITINAFAWFQCERFLHDDWLAHTDDANKINPISQKLSGRLTHKRTHHLTEILIKFRFSFWIALLLGTGGKFTVNIRTACMCYSLFSCSTLIISPGWRDS